MQMTSRFPFTPPRDDSVADANRQLIDWLTTFPLGDEDHPTWRYARAGGVELAAFTASPSVDATRLAVAGQFCTWLFATDDVFGDEATAESRRQYVAVLPELLAILDPPFATVAVTSIFGAALVDIRDALLTFGDRARVTRWADGLREALLSLLWELQAIEDSTPVSYDSYRVLRRRNGAVYPCLEVTALLEQIPLDEQTRTRSDLQHLTAIAIDHVGLSNDVVSFPKEIAAAEESPVQLARILERERDLTRDESLTQIVQLCDDLETQFATIASNLHSVNDPAHQWVQVLQRWMRGNLEWSRFCQRYNGTELEH